MEGLPTEINDLMRRLKAIFGKLSVLHEETTYLRSENAKLRNELTMLRLFVDAQTEMNSDALRTANVDGQGLYYQTASTSEYPVDHEALAFFTELPETVSVSEMFEVASEEGIDADTVKRYLRQYFLHGLMRKNGADLEKTEPFRSPSAVL